MNFNQYQKEARKTAIYPKKYAIIYPALGLGGESGEVLEKVKKLLRDNDGEITDKFREEITKELGDVLWYIANLASDLEIWTDTIAISNLEKLSSRKRRGVLHGSGDNR